MKHFACVLFCLLLLPLVAYANERAQGYCTQGGQVVVTSGISSATKVQQSYPACTVTVYVSGTLTLATIYSDNSNTPLSNPFSASSVGLWFFYAGNGRYDVKLSGGGIPSPFTLGDILLLDAAAGGGIVSSVTGSTGISVSPTSGAVVVTNTWGTPIPTQTTFPSPFPTVTNRNNNSYWLGTRFQYNNGTGYDFHGQPDPAGAMVVDLVVPATASDSAIAGAAIIGRGVTFGSTGAVGVQGLGFVAVNGGSGWGGVSYVQPDITGSYGSSFHATINGMIGFGHEADCNMFADGSGNAQGQCIPFWAAGSSDLQTTGDSAAFANGALGGVKTGNLSTNGTAVTRISGAWFDAAWPTQNSKIVLCPSSTPCTSGGTTYTISTVNSVSSLTLGSSAGVNANLAYYIGSLLPYDYGYRSYNGRSNIGIRLGTLHNNSSTDLGGYTGVWPTDQSQPLYFDNLNSNVSQTTALSASGGGVFQVNSPNGVQFITNAAKQGFFFDVQDGIGITGDPNTAQTVEYRFLSSGFSANNYDTRITSSGGTNGTNGAGTLEIDAGKIIGGFNGALDVRSYGAKGDGVTDDATAIQACINALPFYGGACFFPPGVFVLGTGISLPSQGQFLWGQPSPSAAGSIPPTNGLATVIVEKAGANLAYMIRLNSSLQGLRDLVIDGNKANNPSGQDAVLVNLASRADFDHVSIQNAKRYGLYIHSSANESCCGQAIKLNALNNGSSGVYVDGGTADWKLSMGEIGGNGGDGIELNPGQNFQIGGINFGGNINGVHPHGGSAAGFIRITGNTFGEVQDGVKIDGTGGGNTQNVVLGNVFIANTGTANTYDAIAVISSPNNTISGNTINGGGNYRYGINVDGSSAGTVSGFNSLVGTFGTAALSSTTYGGNNTSCGNNGSGISGTTQTQCYIGSSNFSAPFGAADMATYSTSSNCSSSASPAVCGSAAAGSVVVAAAATTVVVDTTAVTANSQVIIAFDASLGSKLGVTCNTTVPSAFQVSARSAGTSFTITSTAPVTNPACFSYWIVN